MNYCLSCGNPTKKNSRKFCSPACYSIYSKGTAEKRFWVKVKKSKGCWEWQAGFFKSGYGAFSYKGKPTQAHRVSYLLCIGPIPDELWVLHKCDNRSCVKPSHLYLGTVQDNVADMMERGRHGTKGVGWTRI